MSLFDLPRPVLSVGILSADLLNLGGQLRILEREGARMLHVDVMDGRFCPQLTVGPVFVKALRTSLLKDVHLMVEDPQRHLDEFATAGADIITIHVESTGAVRSALRAIPRSTNTDGRSRPVARGIALNPHTKVGRIESLLDDVDLVLLLAVEPGSPHKGFDAAIPARLAALRTLVRPGNRVLIGIDGGVTRRNVETIAALAPDFVVSGSAVFANGRVEEGLRYMLARLAPQPRT